MALRPLFTFAPTFRVHADIFTGLILSQEFTTHTLKHCLVPDTITVAVIFIQYIPRYSLCLINTTPVKILNYV